MGREYHRAPMPQKQSNQVARVFAVFALIGALLLVVVMVASSGGGDDGGGSDAEADDTSKAGERALQRGIWKVRSGDTLVSISEATGLDTDEILELNPEVDPQAVRVGQQLLLREGVDTSGKTDAGGSPGADATGVGDEGPTGSGVGDEGPTGTTDGFGE